MGGGDRSDTSRRNWWMAGTSRIEAFSDGVYAIAITLLVLNLGIPDGLSDGQVWEAIAAEGPKFLAAAISFAVIGLFWKTHHQVFRHLDRTTTGLVWLNLGHLAADTPTLPAHLALGGRRQFHHRRPGVARLARRSHHPGSKP